ncbi:MAG: HNH endonuclease signature motif containing protein [Gemmatimonadota bacterium]
MILGGLRAMRDCQGMRKSSSEFREALKRVQEEIAPRVETPATLVRGKERNVLRNSGIYWKALNLLGPRPGVIELTDFGQRVADGAISRAEFAAVVVQSFTLPNPHLSGVDWSGWRDAHLEIRPLLLILEIILAMREAGNPGEAYLALEELVRVVIPLAGAKAELDDYVAAIEAKRRGDLDLSAWPDCVPEDNDPRMADEFLRFLSHWGYLNREKGSTRYTTTYWLSEDRLAEVREVVEARVAGSSYEDALTGLRESGRPLFVDRVRITIEVIRRPGQQAFRREVLRSFESRCVLTGETIPDVLIAAHIIPVKYGGGDDPGNGLCLRSDVHTLFDAGHIRISPERAVHLSELAGASPSYGGLAGPLALPPAVSEEVLRWRWRYN